MLKTTSIFIGQALNTLDIPAVKASMARKKARKSKKQPIQKQTSVETTQIKDNSLWYDKLTDLDLKEIASKHPQLIKPLTDFLHKGYAVIENSVSEELCDQVLCDWEKWRTVNSDYLEQFRENDSRLPRIINLHQHISSLKCLFSLNKSLDLQDLLFQSQTSVYTSLYYEKGSAQPIHRDIPYFWTYPGNYYLGMWVALENTDEDNGGLSVIPGGHKIPRIDREECGKEFFSDLNKIPAISSELWDSYQSKVAKLCESQGLKETTLQVKKGDTVIWHPLLPHGGSAIKDMNRTRLSLVMHTTPVGTPVYQGDVFFNPRKEVPIRSSWEYEQFLGRSFVKRTTSIGHEDSQPDMLVQI